MTQDIEFNLDEIKPIRFVTREEWLVAAINAMRPWFEAIEVGLPRQIRVSVGFNLGSAAENAQTRGVTWSTGASTDGTNHVFISPELGSAFEVLRTLLHELVHVSDDCASGHTGAFAERARKLGLVGKMTSSEAGPVLTAELCTLADVLGEYPHTPMNVTRVAGRRPTVTVLVGAGVEGTAPATSGPAKQGTRNVKLECGECGNTCRSTRKWIDLGRAPICPCNMQQMTEA